MFTTCTHCGTRFKVTAKQLKAADGQVRCGQCEQVFDAYENLESKKTKTAPKPKAEPAEISLNVGSETTPDLNVKLEAEAEPPAAEALNLQHELLDPEVPPLEELFDSLPDGEQQRTLRAPLQDVRAGFLVEQDARQEKPLPLPLQAEPEPPPSIEQEAEDPDSMYVAAVGVHAAHAELLEPPKIDFEPSHDLPALPQPKPRRPAHGVLWWGGLMALAVLLLVQLMNLDRDDLSRNLVIGPTLQWVYGALGMPLSPAQSVADWDVDGINVTSDPDLPGALSITGSLTNHAAFVQPWPMLRVVLTDRYGETLRARDFKPAEYLPGNQSNVQLAAGQASRFRLDIVDPGVDAVGFTLTPCLDAAPGRICSTPEHD